MEKLFYKELPSTHLFLVEEIKKGVLRPPIAVYCDFQTQGVGSRENEWRGGEGNLYLSFSLETSFLPEDLPLSAYSIYFGTLFQITLASYGSKAWVKWPNDIYLEDKKIGGVITTLFGKNVVCGVGCNLVSAPSYATVVDIKLIQEELINSYLHLVEKRVSWKEVFRIFSVQFDKSRDWFVHAQEERVSLRDAILCEDGSVTVNSQRMTSSR